ncbi:hypothetical protein THICB1_150015 [Thiomonas arsenitoxydans]|uniref:Uncharacterized protein n=1 Tax=Thiomonas arsenitoxydans (strain DSM 22701 / CIP 110005 / 3As) TaxID=426114 RepID=A0ABM9T397_THIA3|nr:hypothetical protein THICB1_150015 [Thiomonas arsenitoxydans]CQR35759.1 hypothetical protein THICB6_230097 [Thiomonas arsenitoxydans]
MALVAETAAAQWLKWDLRAEKAPSDWQLEYESA